MYWICQVQPRGPYRIAGWSAGGIISFEIVKRLIQKGEQVDLLGLIDTWCHRDQATRRSNHFDDKSELLQFLSRRIDSTKLVQLKELAETCTFPDLVGHIYRIGAVPKEFGSLPILNEATIRCALATRHAINKALDDYELSTLSAPTWLFAAEQNDASTSEGWSHFLKDDIHICAVRGNHLTMMETPENLSSLGAAISSALRAACKQPDSIAR
jgi:syringomycin synthetase protein SyrE